MVKKSHDDLLYILDFLFKKREELISPFLNNDYEWIGPSFKYEGNQVAFDLVRECFVTLWIDKHITDIVNENIPEHIRNKTIGLLSKFMHIPHSTSNELDDSQIKHSLLQSKLNVLKMLLQTEESNSRILNELRYSYEKDKALFEREFSKYEALINQND